METIKICHVRWSCRGFIRFKPGRRFGVQFFLKSFPALANSRYDLDGGRLQRLPGRGVKSRKFLRNTAAGAGKSSLGHRNDLRTGEPPKKTPPRINHKQPHWSPSSELVGRPHYETMALNLLIEYNCLIILISSLGSVQDLWAGSKILQLFVGEFA